MRPLSFRSSLALQIENFIRLQQLSGTDYHSQSRLLCYFDRFMLQENVEGSQITGEIIDRYLQTLSHLAPRVRSNRYCVVRQLCRYLSRTDPLIYIPERMRTISSYSTRRCYIYSEAEIVSLLAAAAELPPVDSLRPHTVQTLLGLLYSTGMRIGEAFALNLNDFDAPRQRLFVAQGKFHKARWVPLSASTCRAVQSYLEMRTRIKPSSPDSPLFLNLRSQRLKHATIFQTFRHLLNTCEIGRGLPVVPRIHDLRHTFAVHRLLAWYKDGNDVNARLPWLATYMGHVEIASTQIYLQAIPELTEQVAHRFRRYYLQNVEHNEEES